MRENSTSQLAELEFTDFERCVADAVSDCRGAGRYSALSALRHINRAYQLIEAMPELSVFSGLTAEEEAATAVFHSLRKRKYRRAKELDLKNHRHKAGLWPLVLGIREAFVPLFETSEIHASFIDHRLELIMNYQLEDGNSLAIQLTPPLGFISVDKGGKNKTYREEVEAIATQRGARNMYEHIKQVSNTRNTMLYASGSKVPKSTNAINFFLQQRQVVFVHLSIYLLLEHHKKIQPLAQAGLEIFLDTLRRM